MVSFFILRLLSNSITEPRLEWGATSQAVNELQKLTFCVVVLVCLLSSFHLF